MHDYWRCSVLKSRAASSKKHLLTRRDMLAMITTPVVLSTAPFCNGSWAIQEPHSTAYDLLIKGGKVVDPSQDLEEERDVAIRGGKIVLLEKNIPANQARQVLDAKGKIITPGLIDLHAHVLPYVGETGTEPDACCVTRGVTTVVDAGTSGAFTLPALRKFVVDKSETRVRALLHIVAIGMVVAITPGMEELGDLRYCDAKRAVKAALENKDLVLGFKVRIDRKFTVPGSNDIEAMRRARIAGDEASLPLTTHIGGSYTPLKEFLALMKERDIVTHIYNPRPNSILDESGLLLPEVVEARKRGVRFDIGHGRTNFSYRVAEKCLGQGLVPDTISSDVSNGSIRGPVFDLLTTMSKLMLLGMSLREVVERTTINAARALNFGLDIGTLRPGAEADVAILELRAGEFNLVDSEGQTRIARQKLMPAATVRGGKVFRPAGS
jgi:dihydroorotase